MKIALVSPYDFMYPGGVVNHISSLQRHLTRLGQEVKIIAPVSKQVPAVEDWFIPLGRPRSVPANGSIARITLSVNLASRIKEVLDQENFDVVHLHEPLMPTMCTSILRISEAINVGTFHATYQKPWYSPGSPLDGYNFGRPISTMFLRKWVRNLDGRIAVSRPAMEFASSYFPGEYQIIPNGVELEHFTPEISPIEEFNDGKINILFVGRLENRKGFKYLLEAYQMVKRQTEQCRLIVVGPGNRLRRKYEYQTIFENIKDVVFAGYVGYDDLPRYYRTADIFCAPATHCESFGIVLLEAMSMGRPVIASDNDGYASLITNGLEGILVPPRDSQSLYRALLSLAADGRLRHQMGLNGRRKAQQYCWENVARRVLEYYRSLYRSGKNWAYVSSLSRKGNQLGSSRF